MEKKETIKYYANGLDFKIEKEEDGWYSIYQWNEYTMNYMPKIQAKDLEHAKTFCNFCEPKVVPLQKL